VFRRLPVDEALGLRTGARHRLREVYRERDLIILGLGVMIGAGIFSIAGGQAASVAGPAVIVSFVIAGAVCLLSALSYAELSSALPVAGSAYSFTYVIFGELWAWVIGWAMVLELLLAAAVVSRAWSFIAVQTLDDFGISIPAFLAPYVGQPDGFDLFSLIILVSLVAIVAVGARIGLRVLWAMVAAKVAVIGLVIVFGVVNITFSNYTPFVPASEDAPVGPRDQTVLQAITGHANAFGIGGVIIAAASVAFAYIGFDIIATAAEETENPRHDLPNGMLRSLLVTTGLYLGVAFVIVGMRPYTQLGSPTPLSDAFRAVNLDFMAPIIDLGGLLGLTTVILVVLIGQTRVVFSMARDNLLPATLAEVNKAYHTPTRATMVIGVLAIAISQIVDVLTLQELVVIGALFAFGFVSAEVIALRYTHPDLERGFRVPGAPVVPGLGILGVLWLMLNLQVTTWGYFCFWMAGGLIIYLWFGQRHSRLGRMLAGKPVDGGHHRHRAPGRRVGRWQL
jgi:basic amino acid/polyamine antiporter, APA family